MSIVTFGPFTTETENLPAASRARIEQLGFSAALQNCVAGRKAKLKAEGYSDEAIEQDIADRQRDQFDAILAGVVRAVGTGPRATDPAAAIRKAVTKEYAKAFAESKGSKLSKDKEKLASFLAAYGAKFADKIEAEVSRRLEARKAEAGEDFDLDELLVADEPTDEQEAA